MAKDFLILRVRGICPGPGWLEYQAHGCPRQGCPSQLPGEESAGLPGGVLDSHHSETRAGTWGVRPCLQPWDQKNHRKDGWLVPSPFPLPPPRDPSCLSAFTWPTSSPSSGPEHIATPSSSAWASGFRVLEAGGWVEDLQGPQVCSSLPPPPFLCPQRPQWLLCCF